MFFHASKIASYRQDSAIWIGVQYSLKTHTILTRVVDKNVYLIVPNT
uniref:Uncharacterized protein n=1 Tax=Arundo donax TaxID=35708 RepID=A0A0A9HMU1_ARUDO